MEESPLVAPSRRVTTMNMHTPIDRSSSGLLVLKLRDQIAELRERVPTKNPAHHDGGRASFDK